jgi:hypothetical protein
MAKKKEISVGVPIIKKLIIDMGLYWYNPENWHERIQVYPVKMDPYADDSQTIEDRLCLAEVIIGRDEYKDDDWDGPHSSVLFVNFDHIGWRDLKLEDGTEENFGDPEFEEKLKDHIMKGTKAQKAKADKTISKEEGILFVLDQVNLKGN